jgi:hypothetical protein
MLFNALPTNDTLRANSFILRCFTSYEIYSTLQINQTTWTLFVSQFILILQINKMCGNILFKS